MIRTMRFYVCKVKPQDVTATSDGKYVCAVHKKLLVVSTVMLAIGVYD